MLMTRAGHHCSAKGSSGYCSLSTFSATTDRANRTPCQGQSEHLPRAKSLYPDAHTKEEYSQYGIRVVLAIDALRASSQHQLSQRFRRQRDLVLSIVTTATTSAILLLLFSCVTTMKKRTHKHARAKRRTYLIVVVLFVFVAVVFFIRLIFCGDVAELGGVDFQRLLLLRSFLLLVNFLFFHDSLGCFHFFSRRHNISRLSVPSALSRP